MTEAEIAQRRIETLTEQGMYERRDALRAQLEDHGLSRVQTAELHMLEEACMQLDQANDPRPGNPEIIGDCVVADGPGNSWGAGTR